MREKELWNNILSALETELSKATIAAFFQGTELGSLENGLAKVFCPNRLSAEHLRLRYTDRIAAALSLLLEQPYQVVFEAKAPATTSQTQELGPIFRVKDQDGLSTNYTFNNFVVGLSNQLAVNVAQAVVEKPGTLHNPLFLYSGVGLGKTHLLHAIGNTIKASDPESNVLYCPAERFTNELIRSIQDRRSTVTFRRKYRSLDVLLVDDIQFIAGREATQEEFFNTFNELYLAGKQIILTSDKNPSEIKRLEERLVSRFLGGMIADIQEPDLDLRVGILRQKAAERGANLKEEVILSLAQQVSGNIRQLEGALHQLISLTLGQNISASGELINQLVKNLPRPRAFASPEEIIAAVCRHFSVTPETLRGSTRVKEVVLPRQIAAYLLRNLAQVSLSKIGDLLGGRDHTTILYSLEKVETELPQNAYLREHLEAAKVEILGKVG